jgi:Domain of unknown function (DUF4440)
MGVGSSWRMRLRILKSDERQRLSDGEQNRIRTTRGEDESVIRQIIFIVILAVSSVTVIKGQGSADSSDKSTQAILKVEEETDHAFVNADWDQLGRYWADALVYVNGKGETRTKPEWLAYLRSGAMKYYPAEHSDVRVHIYQDTAVITGYSTTKTVENGKVSTGPRRFTKVYVKQDGAWQLVLLQITPASKQ